MIPGELSRRQLFTETLPQMGAAALMLVGGGERPMPAEQASKLLEIEETRRILFESLSFPDKFSSRTARMRSLYPLAQEVAAELFADEDTPFEPQGLGFLNDRYITVVTAEHRIRSGFLPTPWTVHEAVAPSSTNRAVYANAENGNPWLSTSDLQADMEFTLMSTAAQFQGASRYTPSSNITFTDKNVFASWGGYLFMNSESGPELFHRFADGLNIQAARILLLKKQANYLREHHDVKRPSPLYPVSDFYTFAEFTIIDVLSRLNLSAEELARVTCREGASAMLSFIASTYQEKGYDKLTGIDAQTAAQKVVQLPELLSGDNYKQLDASYNTIVLPAMDRLLPPITAEEPSPGPNPSAPQR
ncbi:hypothetical protein A3A55_00635 [Candidatus Roizmanbacteria bacterium RIFCSPLOWO2_01_FULL_40_14]|nr:MAG: hypothetical protein A3A55_00635 [Candidatus Roizmanbacteria bacterium RIFCSPLOWO2_01_FULL_40_14]